MNAKQIWQDTVSMGLTTQLVSPFGDEVGILRPGMAPSDRPADLRAIRKGPDMFEVTALTPDGDAFLKLVQ